MALRRAVPPAGVYGGDDGVALDEFAGLDGDPVRPQRLGDLLHIADGRPGCRSRARPRDAPLVGDLAARLGVERGAVEDQLDTIRVAVVADNGHPFAVDEDPEN